MVWECLVSVFRWPLEVLRATLRSRRDWEAHPEVRAGSVVPPRGPGGVRDHPRGPEGVEKLTRRSGWGQEGQPSG